MAMQLVDQVGGGIVSNMILFPDKNQFLFFASLATKLPCVKSFSFVKLLASILSSIKRWKNHYDTDRQSDASLKKADILSTSAQCSHFEFGTIFKYRSTD